MILIHLIIIVFLVSLPVTFKLTHRIFGNLVSNAAGAPTGLGFLIHALVALGLLMLTQVRSEGAIGSVRAIPECLTRSPDGSCPPGSSRFAQTDVCHACRLPGEKGKASGYVYPDLLTCGQNPPPPGSCPPAFS
jgi:hypothetical protein